MNYRRVIRFSGFALGGILFLIALGLLLVHTSPVRKIFLNKLSAILQTKEIAFEAADLEYNLFRSSVTLHKVVVRSAAAPDLPPIAQADQLSVTINSWKLLYGTIDIGDAVVTRPLIDFAIDERGKNNLPVFPPGTETESSNTYLIRHLLITHGSLHFEDRRSKIDLRLPGWEVTAVGNAESLNHEIRLSMDRPGSITFEDRVLPIDTLSSDALVGMKWGQVRDLQFSSGGSRISIAAKMNNFKAAVLEATSIGTLQIAPILKFAGLPPQLAGTLKVDITAGGPFAAMKVRAKLAGDNLSVEKFQGLQLAADATYTIGTPRIELASLNLRSSAGSIEVTGIVALEREADNTRLQGRIVGLDLREASKIAKLPVNIASRANGSMRLQWPGLSYREAVGDANVRLDASQLNPQKNVVPISGLISAKFDGRRITASLNPIQSMGALAHGALNVDLQNRLGGEIQIESPSLGWTLRQLDLFQGNAVKSPPVLDGTVRIVAKIGGTVARPTAALEAEASNLNAGSLEGASATASADYDPNALTIKEAVIRWRGQLATAQGVIDLKGKTPTIDVSARIDNGSVADVVAGVGMPENAAQGNFNVTAHITGALRDPSAQVSAAATALHAYGEDLGSLALDAQFANDTATITRLRMEKPAGGFVDATGTYNLGSQAYSIAGSVRNFVIEHLTPSGSGPIRGELNASVEGSGTTADPHLNLTVNVKDVTVEDRNYGTLAATMRVENHQAMFEATAPNYSLSASGQVGIAPDYPAQLRLDVKALDLSKIPAELQPDLKGTASVALRASGSLTKWEQGEASGSLEADLKWNGEPISTASPVVFKYGKGLLTVESGTLTATGSTVRVSGSLPVLPTAPDGEIRLQGDFDLSHLPAFVPELALDARGKLVLDATLRGNAKKIDPSGTIELTGGYAARPGINPVSNVALSAVLQGGMIQLKKLSADWASSKIESIGEIPLALLPVSIPFNSLPYGRGSETARPASLKLDVTGLDIASIEGVPAEVKGAVTMHLEAQAPKLELGAITGRLSFERLNLNLGGLPLDQQGTSSIQVRGGVAVVEQFVLAGTGTELRLTGSTDLNRTEPALNLQASGNFDAAIVTSFVQAIKARGPGELRLAVTGNLPQPKVAGYVELSGASINLQTPKLAADNLNVRVNIDQDQLTIARLEGSMNGGTIAGKGTLGYSGDALQANLNLSAKDVYLSFPQGLKTVSDTELTLRNVGEALVLGGQVQVVEGSYTDRVDLGTGLLGYIRSGQTGIDTNEEKNRFLSSLKFDIGVNSKSPLTINNNLAKAGVNLDLRVVGSYYRPSLVGRISIEEGGELYFSEKKYVVERGIVSLTNEQRIEPSFDIQAKTQASKYEITLSITGGGSDKLETVLTSDPTLPEPDIMALLITGRTLDEVRGSEANVAGEQVLSYLAGSIGGRLSGSLQRATGLSQVRIEPNLIAAESDPSARLTVGQNLTKNARLTYSMNLANSGDQIYIAEYDITKRFTTSAIKQSDNSYRFEFRHEVRLGGDAGDAAEAKRHPRSVGTVKFEGNSVLTPDQLSKKFKVKAGKTYDFLQVQKGMDRIESSYTKLHRLEARVRMKRDQTDRTVDLTVTVNAGPKIEFVYEGWRPSGGIRKRVDSIWKDGVFDSQRIDEAQDAIRAALIKQGRLESKIEHIVSTPAPDVKRVVFDIQPGPQFRNVKVMFAGAAAIKPKKLNALLKTQKLRTDVYTRPDKVVTSLTNYYHGNGFLAAKVKPPKLQLDAATRTGTVTIPIEEGPHFKVGTVTFVGNKVYSAAALREALPMKNNASYDPAMREESVNKLQDLYWSKGYNEVDITSSIALDRGLGRVALTFSIVEKRPDIVRGIQVAGNHKTSESMIRTQLAVKPGDAMSGEKLSKSRRALYTTGAYSLVDIAKTPASQEPENSTGPRPMDLTVKVREVPPFDIRYGGFFDTDRGPGGIVDLRNHNSLGSAREIGFRARYDSNVQEGRVYFGQPLLKRFPLKTTATTFFRREKVDAFITDKFGATIQQEARFRQHYILNYGYRMENVHTYDKVPDPTFPFDIRLRIAPLTSTLTRETRDDILDATRGSFTSQAFEWAPAALGSQLRFVRYFGQYFKYVPLGQPSEVPWSGGLRKTRLVYAGGVRGGLATGLGGQDLIPSERFFAGGGTTIRGFKQNSLGPLDSLGNAQGGNALFLINNELRFPGIGIFDGVAFADIGNVFKTAADFSLTGLRKTGGAGLRVRTPYFLIRFDYGFKLDRRPSESIGNFFFSIGQAF